MGDAAVAGGNGNVLQLDVHVILGFQQFPPVDDSRCDLERNDVTLRFVEELDRDADRASELSHSGGVRRGKGKLIKL